MAELNIRSRSLSFAIGSAALVLPAIAVTGTVWACSDSSCSPNWRLAAPSYDCAGRGTISPGNDTRINLLLLMRSLKPVADVKAASARDEDNPQFGRAFMSWTGLRAAFWPQPPATPSANYEAHSCALPTETVSAFAAALAAETGLSEAERNDLGKLRAQVGCGAVQWKGVAVSSARGREYLAYLKASDAFYHEDWVAARQGFAALKRAKSRWVAETASYMPIRIGMRSAVATAVNEYGDFAGTDKVDPAAVAEARAGISAYLKAYPNGQYAESAKGLVRRAAWLSGDTAALARAYETLVLTTPGGDEAAADLAEEIDIKLLEREDLDAVAASLTDTPLLLAIIDLKRMRRDEGTPMALAADDLARQRKQFAAYSELYGLLEASRAFYADENPKAILALLPDAARAARFTPLAFSRQVLRGTALSQAGDPNEAGFWLEMLGGASPSFQRPIIEMGLATRWQRDGKLEQVFAQGSPITDPTIREILLQTMASPAILRSDIKDNTRPAHERDVARFTLLYKGLARGAYNAFVTDVALVPQNANVEAGLWSFAQQEDIPVGLFLKGKWSDGFACPAIAQTAATLARTPGDANARLCLGDFYRLNGFDGFSLFTPGKEKEALGSGPDAFPGKSLARSDIYAAIIADQRVAANERAYALYRAVMCYSPSGYNGCSGAYVDGATFDAAQAPKATRKAWFTELKQRYPESRWAKSLQYYW